MRLGGRQCAACRADAVAGQVTRQHRGYRRHERDFVCLHHRGTPDRRVLGAGTPDRAERRHHVSLSPRTA